MNGFQTIQTKPYSSIFFLKIFFLVKQKILQEPNAKKEGLFGQVMANSPLMLSKLIKPTLVDLTQIKKDTKLVEINMGIICLPKNKASNSQQWTLKSGEL